MSEHSKRNFPLDAIVSLAKQRGFIYQGSEIYGGIAGMFDYGPLGTLLKRNIVDAWVNYFVHGREDMFLIDSAILMNKKVWEASGHVEEFVDPLVDDLKTNKRYRADHLLEDKGIDPSKMTIEQMTQAFVDNKILSPEGNPVGPVRKFNMMLETKVGAMEDSSATSYLRPETAQGIFLNYKNVVDSFAPKLPFGIAQIGKAFRNEITPRDFIFRLRELEQMEIEYFIHPNADWLTIFTTLFNEQKKFLNSIGIKSDSVHEYEHPDEARSHYSKKTVDWEFDFAFGTKELTGIAYRTNYDLTQHAEHSKTKLTYFDIENNEHVVPHVIEPTFGLDRLLLAVLTDAYEEQDLGEGNTRTVLHLQKNMAPYLCAVSPLLKNNPEMVEKAQGVYKTLKTATKGRTIWEDNSNIGKRYRRQDEIGTPYCVVVDHQTLEDNTVTVRDRDTMAQERVAIDDLIKYIA